MSAPAGALGKASYYFERLFRVKERKVSVLGEVRCDFRDSQQIFVGCATARYSSVHGANRPRPLMGSTGM